MPYKSESFITKKENIFLTATKPLSKKFFPDLCDGEYRILLSAGELKAASVVKFLLKKTPKFVSSSFYLKVL